MSRWRRVINRSRRKNALLRMRFLSIRNIQSFVFGDKKLKDVKSEEELKQLIQQADDGTITTKTAGGGAQTLLNGMNKEFWISEVDGRLQNEVGQLCR